MHERRQVEVRDEHRGGEQRGRVGGRRTRFSSHAKPVQVISAPTRFVGRRAAGVEAGADPGRADAEADRDRQAAVGRRGRSASDDGRAEQPEQRGPRAPAAPARGSVRFKRAAPGRARPRARPSGRSRARRSGETSGPKSDESRLETRITAGESGWPVMRAATSKPSMSGSWTSSSTSWGFRRQVSSTALAPSTASPMTLNPSDSRSTRALARKDGWSSTIRTVQSTGSIVVTVRTRSHTAGRTTRLRGFLPADGG